MKFACNMFSSYAPWQPECLGQEQLCVHRRRLARRLLLLTCDTCIGLQYNRSCGAHFQDIIHTSIFEMHVPPTQRKQNMDDNKIQFFKASAGRFTINECNIQIAAASRIPLASEAGRIKTKTWVWRCDPKNQKVQFRMDFQSSSPFYNALCRILLIFGSFVRRLVDDVVGRLLVRITYRSKGLQA